MLAGAKRIGEGKGEVCLGVGCAIGRSGKGVEMATGVGVALLTTSGSGVGLSRLLQARSATAAQAKIANEENVIFPAATTMAQAR